MTRLEKELEKTSLDKKEKTLVKNIIANLARTNESLAERNPNATGPQKENLATYRKLMKEGA